jgi:pyruvate,water dikinase
MKNPHINIFQDWKENAREFHSVYQIQKILAGKIQDIRSTLEKIVAILPSGFQFPDICEVRLNYDQESVMSPKFAQAKWKMESPIHFQGREIGSLQVGYTEERPMIDEGPFLKKERRLIDTVTDQIGVFFFYKQLKTVFEDQDLSSSQEQKYEWWIVLEMLRKTNPKLVLRIARKMVNYLFWKGIQEAETLYKYFDPINAEQNDFFKESNYPYQARSEMDSLEIISKVVEISNKYLGEEEILDNISRWIKEDQSGFMVNILGNMGSTMEEIISVIERYHFLKSQGLELSPIRKSNLKVTLIRRLLSEDTEFVNIAKKFIEIDEFHNMINSTIHPKNSHGKYGGKSAGLFVSKYILQRSKLSNEFTKRIKLPKSWFITSDGILSFIQYNQLEDIVEQKYKSIEEVRKEYPYVSHVFKNASLPPEFSKGLWNMLDDFDKVPLVVRSTSLLEDQPNSIFAGKYKSLFISNQGSKKERMLELTNAITEVYASTFGPDPIEYRLERGLIDFNEEMGILIQQVVGQQVGKYYLPAFAGVAFSENNFRWSARIKQEDGLLRIVPGLGTRAVDRLSDDYPVLISPGKANLRVNVTVDELIRYSPKVLDVIDLEDKKFKSIEISQLIMELGASFPMINHIVSKMNQGFLQDIRPIGNDFEQDEYIVTFNSLIKNTDFVKEIGSAIKVLEKEFRFPVDLEFAHDGQDLYLLQCRQQSHGEIRKAAEIPTGLPPSKVIFTAKKHITNGALGNISHVVYVSPDQYSKLSDHEKLKRVGKAIGKLNAILPKRQFILMGPGRWGSRGDIKLGVSVTYSQINNTAMLVEIARKKKDYVPELSFGTHFFQDLVEANIFYLPLYPDEQDVVFNDAFFNESKNIFSSILPKYKDLEDVIRVIGVSHSKKGNFLNIAMNEEEAKAIAYISGEEVQEKEYYDLKSDSHSGEYSNEDSDFHWKWRLRTCEQIARKLDGVKYGVKRFFVLGSTINATAKPESDVDVMLHFAGDEKQKKELLLWLDGWSLSMDYFNYLRTGHKSGGVLDIKFVTDEDIARKSSLAMRIDAVTNAAREFKMKSSFDA